METFNINSFLPAYPSLDTRNDNLFELFPRGFYNGIYHKKEFNQLQPDLTKSRVMDGGFHAQPQQIYAQRYASYHTLYDNQIIIHSMGLGKTALAVMTIENNLNNGFVGGLVAVPSKKFISSFITEIVKITGTKYYPEKYRDLTDAELQRAIKSQIGKVYQFITFVAFANKITKGVTAQQIAKQYSNHVIVVDEAHNLRIQPEKKALTSHVNAAFHLLFHSVSNCKILLMTATPMKDRWNEIADLANLLLPLDRQLPSGAGFDQEYLNNGIEIQNEELLKTYFHGMISTLRTIPSTVKREFIGNFVAGLQTFKMDLCQMSEFQAQVYMEAYAEDTSKGKASKASGIYSASRQAINFVFPDKSYGAVGFSRYMLPVQKAGIALIQAEKNSRGNVNKDRPYEIETLGPKLLEVLQGNTYEERLRKLSVFSSKYAKTILDILEQRSRKGGNTFIYNTSVEGSGLIVFARILELFGYQRSVNGIETTPGKRYVILTNETLDDKGKIIANVQKTVNDPKNARGDYIQVILGSRTAGEGLSFYNVENIGIHTPHWNYSETDQAIGRGIRYGSHEEITKIYAEEGKEFKVNIHHYAAVPQESIEESIDIIMYKLSEDKDLRIKRGERFLKQISYDCGNNRLVNMRGVDGSRECEYLTCSYKCEGIDNDEIVVPEEKLDFNSFNNLYADEEIDEIITETKELFRTKFTLTLTELREHFKRFQYFILLKSLKKIIDQSIPIINQFGFKCYLREHNDVYFIVDTMEKPSSSLSAYYTANPPIKSSVPFNEYISEVQLSRSEDFLEYIYQASLQRDFTEVLNYWNRLPLGVKEELLHAVIEADRTDDRTDDRTGGKDNENSEEQGIREFRKWLMNLNTAGIFNLEDGTVITSLSEGIFSCREEKTGEWKDCSDNEEILRAIEEQKKEVVVNLEENPYGYYARVNKALLDTPDGWKNGFWIKNVEKAKQADGTDKRKSIRGEKCSIGTLKLGKLSGMAYKFGLDLDNGMDKGKSTKDIRTVLGNDQYMMAELDIHTLSDEDVRKVYRLYKGKASNLCKLLLEWFVENNLVEYIDTVSMR